MPPPTELKQTFFDLTPEQFGALVVDKALALAELAKTKTVLQARYALTGMIGSILRLLSCVGAYVYLVMEHHSTEAYVVLGGDVLTLITRILSARL